MVNFRKNNTNGATNLPQAPPPPIIDVWNGGTQINGGTTGTVHYFVRHPWSWVMKEIATPSMVVCENTNDLPSAKLPPSVPGITPATPATRRRREARKLQGPSTLKIEITAPTTNEIIFAVHGSSPALDGLEDKDELVRTLQRSRCESLNLTPPSVLLSWDVTQNECSKIVGDNLPVLASNSSTEKFAVLKEPMGSQGRGIFFVGNADEIHKIIDAHRQRALQEEGFLDNLIAVKGRIPSWVLQAEVYPSLLIRNRRKFHIRTYVVVKEKIHDVDQLVDIYLYNRHEVRIAGNSVSDDANDRDTLSHITNGALSNHTERCLLPEVDELVDRNIQQSVELFVATLFGKHLLQDIKFRVNLGAKQEASMASKFALAGLDLMVTEDNRIYLLEVNANPASPPLEMVTPKFSEHLTGLFRDLVNLVVGHPVTNFLNANDILRTHGLLDD